MARLSVVETNQLTPRLAKYGAGGARAGDHVPGLGTLPGDARNVLPVLFSLAWQRFGGRRPQRTCPYTGCAAQQLLHVNTRPLCIGDAGGLTKEKIALRFAERMALNHHEIDDDLFRALRVQFTDAQIVELGMMIGQTVRVDGCASIMDSVFPLEIQWG
jgi:alkylhydroperoxidase family enzyme